MIQLSVKVHYNIIQDNTFAKENLKNTANNSLRVDVKK